MASQPMSGKNTTVAIVIIRCMCVRAPRKIQPPPGTTQNWFCPNKFVLPLHPDRITANVRIWSKYSHAASNSLADNDAVKRVFVIFRQARKLKNGRFVKWQGFYSMADTIVFNEVVRKFR